MLSSERHGPNKQVQVIPSIFRPGPNSLRLAVRRLSIALVADVGEIKTVRGKPMRTQTSLVRGHH
jgi:hypothetical protein